MIYAYVDFIKIIFQIKIFYYYIFIFLFLDYEILAIISAAIKRFINYNGCGTALEVLTDHAQMQIFQSQWSP
jgi:hypothetical protein